MAYTKHFPAGSTMISATYIEEGDRVRLVKYSPVSTGRYANPEVGDCGIVMRVSKSSMAIYWDRNRHGAILNPTVFDDRGDIVELIEV